MKIQIVGGASVLTSSITLDNFKRMKRAHPEALTIVDKETKKPIFAIEYAPGAGSVTNNGICFNTTDKDGNLCLTGLLSPNSTAEQRKQFVMDNCMTPCDKLIDLEAAFTVALNDYTIKASAFEEMIEER